MDVGWVAAFLAVGFALSDRKSGAFIIGAFVVTAILVELDWVRKNLNVIGTTEFIAAAAWGFRWIWWEERKRDRSKDNGEGAA